MLENVLDGAEKFQSTPPRRERLNQQILTMTRDLISIHAPAKGATRASVLPAAVDKFQSTPPRRERQ